MNQYKIRRLVAYAIDWYLSSVLLVAFNYFYSHLKGIETTSFSTVELYDKNDATIVICIMLVIDLIYYVVIPFLNKGRTVGKMTTKLKIVNSEDKKLTLAQLVLREVVGIILVENYISPYGSYLRTYLGLLLGNVKYLSYIWFAISGLSIACGIYSKENKMFHDLIAKTKVKSL